MGEPNRLVVEESSFEYAQRSNRDIVDSLPSSEAYSVLTELGRVDASVQRSLPLGASLRSKPTTAMPAPSTGEAGEDNGDDAALATPPATSMKEVQWRSKGGTTWEDLPLLKEREVLKSGFYFSTVTAVAIEDNLRPTAIPALILGYRPTWGEQSYATGKLLRVLEGWGVGYDFMVGGALNGLSGGDDESDIDLALGVGITIPWSDAGALSIGVTNWRTETTDDMGSVLEDEDWAVYIGISLGGFNVSNKGS